MLAALRVSRALPVKVDTAVKLSFVPTKLKECSHVTKFGPIFLPKHSVHCQVHYWPESVTDPFAPKLDLPEIKSEETSAKVPNKGISNSKKGFMSSKIPFFFKKNKTNFEVINMALVYGDSLVAPPNPPRLGHRESSPFFLPQSLPSVCAHHQPDRFSHKTISSCTT